MRNIEEVKHRATAWIGGTRVIQTTSVVIHDLPSVYVHGATRRLLLMSFQKGNYSQPKTRSLSVRKSNKRNCKDTRHGLGNLMRTSGYEHQNSRENCFKWQHEQAAVAPMQKFFKRSLNEHKYMANLVLWNLQSEEKDHARYQVKD